MEDCNKKAAADLAAALDHHIDLLDGARVYPCPDPEELWVAEGELDEMDGLAAERLGRLLQKRGEL